MDDDLYFNDETGEWYTLGTSTPKDAAGNPITPGESSGDLWNRISSGISGITFNDVKKLFAGTSHFGAAGQLAALGGVGALLNKMLGGGGGGSGFAGYQGGIPSYTATRQQLPIPTTMTTPQGQTVPRRPGAGGIQYFTPMAYTKAAASGGLMGYGTGGIASLGGYSDGGRLLKGPGDGTSDSIPATIGANKKPARLADGEFVVDARTVSELGNGSTDAGAKKLYAMMNRVHSARKNASRGQNTKADKYLPA